MKLTILVILAAVFILFSSFQAPSLFFIGYLWVSTLYPGAFITLPIPFSFLFGLCCIGAFALSKRAKLGRLPILFYVAIAFAVWVTCTTAWAVEANAWNKWFWAIQSVLITAAIPIFLRTRAQLEMGLIVTFSAYSAHVLTAGAKGVLGTGGYDQLGTLMRSGYFLGETSTLALVAIMSIPMANYVARHSEIFKRYRGYHPKFVVAAYTFFAVMCVIGTSARTGVISLGVLLLTGIKGMVKRAAILFCAAIFVLYGQSLLPGRALARFSTISTYQQDDSAMTRIAAWKWALNYVKEHPLGGGFNVFYTSRFDSMHLDARGVPVILHMIGRAPHSIYFEVLGEHGYLGELMLLTLLGGGLWGTYRLSRKSSAVQTDDWSSMFARTLWVCLTVYCAGASFIGVAFQPMMYVLIGLYCGLWRVTKGPEPARGKFSARAVTNAAPA